MSDGKIYITITDKRPLDQSGSTISQTGQSSQKADTSNSDSGKSQGSVLLRYAEHQFFHFVEAEAKKYAMNTLGNIGNFTGDYALQDDINVSLSALSSIANIGFAAIQGAKIGGPIGAAVGAVIGVAMNEINFQMKDKLARLENKKTNIRIEKLRIRSGLDGATNNGRGTEL